MVTWFKRSPMSSSKKGASNNFSSSGKQLESKRPACQRG